jgi:hypothetical protein
MSVLLTFRVRGDAKKIEEIAQRVQAVSKDAANYGIISHRFYGNDEEILVVDEWPDPASFQKFFDAHPEIPDIMQEAGVTSEPEVTFWRKLDTRDDIG